MKKILFLALLLCLNYGVFAQVTGGIFTNNTACNVDVTLYGTSSVYPCSSLVVNTVNVAATSIVGWNTLCSSSFPGWAVGGNPFLSGSSCPAPKVDPTFIWTDATFTFHCSLSCSVSGLVSDATSGCFGINPNWSGSACGAGLLSATYTTSGVGVNVTFN